MKKNINFILILISFFIGGILTYFIFKSKKEKIEIPFKVEVPVPVIEKQFDTIYKNIPIYIENSVNLDLKNKYNKAKDSLEKQKIFLNTIKKRTYSKVFSDSIQDITITAETIGFLNKIQASYKTKPRKIVLDTIINLKVYKKPSIYLGGSIYNISTNNKENNIVGVGPKIAFKNRKDSFILFGGYDVINESINLGLVIKL